MHFSYMNITNIIDLFDQIQTKGWWGSVTFEFKKGSLVGTHVVQTIRQHSFEAEDVLLIVAGDPEKTRASIISNGA